MIYIVFCTLYFQLLVLLHELLRLLTNWFTYFFYQTGNQLQYVIIVSVLEKELNKFMDMRYFKANQTLWDFVINANAKVFGLSRKSGFLYFWENSWDEKMVVNLSFLIVPSTKQAFTNHSSFFDGFEIWIFLI